LLSRNNFNASAMPLHESHFRQRALGLLNYRRARAVEAFPDLSVLPASADVSLILAGGPHNRYGQALKPGMPTDGVGMLTSAAAEARASFAMDDADVNALIGLPPDAPAADRAKAAEHMVDARNRRAWALMMRRWPDADRIAAMPDADVRAAFVARGILAAAAPLAPGVNRPRYDSAYSCFQAAAGDGACRVWCADRERCIASEPGPASITAAEAADAVRHESKALAAALDREAAVPMGGLKPSDAGWDAAIAALEASPVASATAAGWDAAVAALNADRTHDVTDPGQCHPADAPRSTPEAYDAAAHTAACTDEVCDGCAPPDTSRRAFMVSVQFAGSPLPPINAIAGDLLEGLHAYVDDEPGSLVLRWTKERAEVVLREAVAKHDPSRTEPLSFACRVAHLPAFEVKWAPGESVSLRVPADVAAAVAADPAGAAQALADAAAVLGQPADLAAAEARGDADRAEMTASDVAESNARAYLATRREASRLLLNAYLVSLERRDYTVAEWSGVDTARLPFSQRTALAALRASLDALLMARGHAELVPEPVHLHDVPGFFDPQPAPAYFADTADSIEATLARHDAADAAERAEPAAQAPEPEGLERVKRMLSGSQWRANDADVDADPARRDRHLLRTAAAFIMRPELAEVGGMSRAVAAQRLQVMVADSWDKP
jgi:hypothetical protein